MDNPNDKALRDHAMGALVGLALGDALGMPTESMSRTQIAQAYGPITRPRAAVAWQPIAPSMPAGSVTDDTEQALLLARLLIEGHGVIEPMAFAQALSDWEADMEAKGSLDLLGPSTKAAIAAIRAGATAQDDPGAGGTTNGAAMRATPVGIAFSRVARGDRLVAAVVESASLTHNTGLGLSAAGVVAAAVSSALDHSSCLAVDGGVRPAGVESSRPFTDRCDDGGQPATDGLCLSTPTDSPPLVAADSGTPSWSLRDTITDAVTVATPLAQAGNWVAGGSVPERVAWAVDFVADLTEADAVNVIDQIIGTSVASQESIPAAFALASRFGADPYHALCLAAEIGGDTDTMAAIAGAILGAYHGMSAWPTEIVDQVVTVNNLDLDPVVDGLLRLRQ